jgi:hypothetical protein
MRPQQNHVGTTEQRVNSFCSLLVVNSKSIGIITIAKNRGQIFFCIRLHLGSQGVAIEKNEAVLISYIVLE